MVRPIFLALLLFSSVYAQGSDGLVYSLGNITKEISGAMTEYGLVPDLQGFESDQTRAYFIILVMLWLVLSVTLGLGDFLSALLAYLLSSLAFNNFASLFQPSVASGLFEYVFSTLFIFVWTEYLFSFAWSFSKSTRLFLAASVSSIAVSTMSITNIFRVIGGWIEWIFTGVGLAVFIVFMIGMRLFVLYSRIVGMAASMTPGGEPQEQDSQRTSPGQLPPGREP